MGHVFLFVIRLRTSFSKAACWPHEVCLAILFFLKGVTLNDLSTSKSEMTTWNDFFIPSSIDMANITA